MKYAPWIALILALCFIAWDWQKDTTKQSQFDTREKALVDSLRDITALQKKYALEYYRTATDLTMAKQALAISNEANKTLRLRNNDLKNRPIRHYSDSAALREITRLTQTN